MGIASVLFNLNTIKVKSRQSDKVEQLYHKAKFLKESVALGLYTLNSNSSLKLECFINFPIFE